MKDPSKRPNLAQCFIDAWRGLVTVFRSERNFRIHLILGSVAVLLGLLFEISSGEWLAIFICIGLVLAAEVMNTAIEYLADTVHPEVDPGIRHAKDAAAGGVLIAAVAAAAVGAMIYLPELWEWLTNGLR